GGVAPRSASPIGRSLKRRAGVVPKGTSPLASPASPPNLGGELLLKPVQYVIFNPLRIPPFGGVHRHTMKEQSEVQVVSRSESRRTALADDLLSLDHLSRFDGNLTHVAVERHQSCTMIDDDGIAVDAEILGQNNLPVVGR